MTKRIVAWLGRSRFIRRIGAFDDAELFPGRHDVTGSGSNGRN